jgi:hypothetical protein
MVELEADEWVWPLPSAQFEEVGGASEFERVEDQEEKEVREVEAKHQAVWGDAYDPPRSSDCPLMGLPHGMQRIQVIICPRVSMP